VAEENMVLGKIYLETRNIFETKIAKWKKKGMASGIIV
jgi:hypothetical protein